MKDDTNQEKVPENDGKTLQRHKTLQEQASEHTEGLSGFFRGVAAAMRKAAIGKAVAGKAAAGKVAAGKAVAAKTAAGKAVTGQTTAKTMVRQIGENRPLAFASEGAVAGESMMPRILYYGAWTLSGVAIIADIYNKQEDAPEDKRWQTVTYWTAFHIPASLVVPAMVIHQIVHGVQHAVENPKGIAKAWPPRAKAFAPVGAALLSIIPVVPAVDTAAEYIMEPTLGAYLGLEFEHHGSHGEKEHGDHKEAGGS